MALPFLEAYGQLKSGKISWQEYIDHLLARCAGGGHEEDDIEGIHRKLRNTDPFGYSIWCWSDSLYKASGMFRRPARRQYNSNLSFTRHNSLESRLH